MRFASFYSKLSLFIAVSVLLFSLLSCSETKEPIKIGLAVNLTGASGTAGEYIRDGALLAMQEINDAGGIKGRPMDLLIRDDHDQQSEILAVDQELIDAGVVAIIGHSNSQNTIVAHKNVTSQNTLLITAYTAATALSGQDDLFFRTAVDNVQYGKALGGLLRQKNVKKASVLLDVSNRSFVEDYVGQTERHFSGKFNQVRINSKKSINWNYVVRQLLDSKPDAVILLTRVNETAIAAQKIRKFMPQLELISSIWAQNPGLLELGGDAVEGLEIITFIDAHYDNPLYNNAAKHMEERFHRPLTARSVRAYELVNILADALKKCSSTPDDEELKEKLLKMEFTTPLGNVRFDQFGDVQRPIYLVSVENGKFIRSTILNE